MFYINYIEYYMNKIKFKLILLIACATLSSATTVLALDVDQFVEWCAKQNKPKPFCEIYLGGALDAIAVMNDIAKTNGKPIYCKPESELFKPEKIIKYVLSQHPKLASKNAILPVLNYLKSEGGCVVSDKK